MIALSRGKLKRCRDVFVFQVWIIRKDLRTSRPGGEQVQHVLHPDPHATDNRPPTTHGGVHGNAMQLAHEKPFVRFIVGQASSTTGGGALLRRRRLRRLLLRLLPPAEQTA